MCRAPTWTLSILRPGRKDHDRNILFILHSEEQLASDFQITSKEDAYINAFWSVEKTDESGHAENREEVEYSCWWWCTGGGGWQVIFAASLTTIRVQTNLSPQDDHARAFFVLESIFWCLLQTQFSSRSSYTGALWLWYHDAEGRAFPWLIHINFCLIGKLLISRGQNILGIIHRRQPILAGLGCRGAVVPPETIHLSSIGPGFLRLDCTGYTYPVGQQFSQLCKAVCMVSCRRYLSSSNAARRAAALPTLNCRQSTL